MRVNIGCGRAPVEGWNNYDNSISLCLARMPVLTFVLDKLGLLQKAQKDFIVFAKRANIKWVDATKHIPESDRSVEVLYSSHMIEHLDREEVGVFLREARRVLIHNGIIRIAVPDLQYYIANYVTNKDADMFIEETRLTRPKPKTLIGRLKNLMVGERHHQWMYDGQSLCNLLLSAGFKEPRIMDAGTTAISEPSNLDLYERSPVSVFVEAINREEEEDIKAAKVRISA